MTDGPLVSVIVPALNEERWIRPCLEAILGQDHPSHRIEVIVVDGGSVDGTVCRAQRVLADAPLARCEVLVNPRSSTPSNLNVGLAVAQGEYVCRVDARSIVPRSYLRTCVDTLGNRPEVVVTGGAQRAIVTEGTSSRQRGIARALNNRWGMGLSRYRAGRPSGPTDTVYLGAFRSADLRAAGGWDERFPTNQDFELNRRLAAAGVVWFDSSLEVGYVPRPTLHEIFTQYTRFGRWKVRYWRATGDRPRPRQWFLLVSPPVLASGLALAVRRTTGGIWGVGATGAVALAALEVLGADAPQARGPADHAWGLCALAAVAFGWWGGVVAEAVQPRAERHPSRG